MSHSRLLVLLLAVLLFGGVVAWVVIDGGDDPAVTPADFPGIAHDEDADDGHDLKDAPAHRPDEPGLITLDRDDNPSAPAEGEEVPRVESRVEGRKDDRAEGGDSPDRDSGDPGARRGDQGGDDAGSSTRRGARDEEQPERRLTRAEREEQRRIEQGRPALRKRLGRTPSAVSATNALAKTPEQEEWEDKWYSEGFTPPEMISTPVRGKIMSEQAREGLGDATVGLISFFPLDGVAGGPLLPVITELTTDDKGFFEGEIPASELAPLNYPRLALAITWETHRVVAANHVDTLKVGEENELGIFWAPELPYQLVTDASQFSGNLSVVSTGELDPQRWHKAQRAEILAYFPQATVATEDPEGEETGPAKGHALLVSTWDGVDSPYISLLDGQSIVQTRRPTRSTIISNKGGDTVPQPFEELVFEDDALTPVSGQVIDDYGAGIANAVITTIGGELSRTVLTDAAGWFYIENPPEKMHSLHCVHDDWVETRVSPVSPGDSGVDVVLDTPRPRITLYVTDKLTQVPVTDISVKVTGLYPWGENKGTAMPVEFTELASSDGNYVFEWQYELASITIEKIGYFPLTIPDPHAAARDSIDGRLTIELSPGRKLEVRPRDYTAVEREDRWYPDPEDGPGIRTNWAHHWIEYDVDFGEAPEEGKEGGSFDMILGCTNHGIVDNEYEFSVDVYVNGEKKGTMTMIADSLHEHTDRLSLGQLEGVHTVRLVWTNDKWIPQQLDANVRYQSLRFVEQP